MPGEETPQATIATETPAPEVSPTQAPELDSPTTPETTTTQPKTEASSINEVEHKLYREKADLFDSLTRDAGFRDWYASRNQPKTPEKKVEPQMTDEELQALWSDPRKYNQYLESKIEARAREIITPIVEKSSREIEILKRTREIENTASIHKDFWELDEKGLIEKTMTKYPNLSAEDAYWLAKREVVEQQALTQAHETINKKRGLVVEKPGVSVGTSKVVKVRSKGELMEKAYEYAKRGEEPPEFDIEGR